MNEPFQQIRYVDQNGRFTDAGMALVQDMTRRVAELEAILAANGIDATSDHETRIAALEAP